jgi:NADPH2:quinone reductase
MLLKGCDVMGVFWGAFLKRDPARHRANMDDLMRWTAEGRLTAHVHGVYSLEETPEALRVIAAREARGKVLIRM